MEGNKLKVGSLSRLRWNLLKRVTHDGWIVDSSSRRLVQLNTALATYRGHECTQWGRELREGSNLSFSLFPEFCVGRVNNSRRIFLSSFLFVQPTHFSLLPEMNLFANMRKLPLEPDILFLEISSSCGITTS